MREIVSIDSFQVIQAVRFYCILFLILEYKFRAGGVSVDEPLVVGKVTAGMGMAAEFTNKTKESYTGHASASGRFNFYKSMKCSVEE